MIKITKIINVENSGACVCELFADTKAEVGTTVVVGLTSLASGSQLLTAAGEVALLKSDNTWGWL